MKTLQFPPAKYFPIYDTAVVRQLDNLIQGTGKNV